jgi:hypothetical protein
MGIRCVKLGEGCLRIPTLTHTHVFGNHNNGYGHLKTAHVQSSAGHHKSESSMVLSWTWFRTTVRFTTFNLFMQIIQSGQITLNTVIIDLAHVSVPVKKDHNSHQPSHMPLRK